MLSTKYRLKLQAICEKIADGEEVSLTDMVWANKLAKANHSAQEIMRAARRKAFSNEEEGGLGDFLQGMGLGNPDPSTHKTRFDGADEIVDWFHQEKTDDWRQRD